MKKIWKAALFEFQRNVFKKSFILLLISVPIFISFSIGVGVFIESTEDNPLPVGYVDKTGVFRDVVKLPENTKIGIVEKNKPLEFISYSNETGASTALAAGRIQVFYIIPTDYPQTRRIEQVNIEKPGNNAVRQFYDFLQINLLSSSPADYANRATLGTEITVRSVDGSRVVPSGGPTFGLLMPIFGTMAFLFMILMSSGYTMNAVAEEKENRTIEVLVTSTSTNHLIAGKILGIIAIGLTLLSTWTLEILTGVLIARGLGISWFQDLNIDWRILLTTLIIGIPAYALVISLMTAIGAMVTTTQEGQSVSAILVILHMIPLYVSWSFLENPNNPLGIVLSLCPFTALTTIGLRNIFTIIPIWQIAASAAVQITCSLGAVWLAGSALRGGMLQYGQRLTWRELFKSGK
jgi:ABC-2 type transport system permease protein